MGESIMGKNKPIKKLLTILLIQILLLTAVSALTIEGSSQTPNEAAPGESVTISMVIENTLNEDVENIQVSLDLSNPELPIAPYSGSVETSIENLDEGDDERVNFRVIVQPGASAGIYKIPVKIFYSIKDNSTRIEKMGLIGLQVNSNTELIVVSEGLLVKGQESEITLRVVNDGLTDAKFVSISLQEPSGVTINSPLYEYLGNIDSDDFDSIDLKVFVKEDFGSSFSLPVTISYRDALNNEVNDLQNINIKAYSRAEAQELGYLEKSSYTIYFIIGLLIFIYIIFRVYKSWKKKSRR
jgi:hypothetical protein